MSHTCVNILYDEEYDDVDIIRVPDDIAQDIDRIAQQFCNWLRMPENSRRFLLTQPDGTQVLGIDTKEFLWWLNHVFLPAGHQAELVTQHVSHRPEFPTANF